LWALLNTKKGECIMKQISKLCFRNPSSLRAQRINLVFEIGLSLVLVLVGLIQSAYAQPATLQFGNSSVQYTWSVRSATDVGPGPNDFSNSTTKIWVDDSGQLHLTISTTAGSPSTWYCTEVEGPTNLGPGTYLWHTKGRVDLLDPSIVAAPFLYWENGSDITEPNYYELDMEFSRWNISGDTVGDTTGRDLDFAVETNANTGGGFVPTYPVVQSPNASGDTTELTEVITWAYNTALFQVYYGYQTWGNLTVHNPDTVAIWVYPDNDVYVPETTAPMQVDIVFFLHDGDAPTNGSPASWIVEDFTFYKNDTTGGGYWAPVATAAPTAGFYATPTSGSGPLTVIFTDTSANTPTSWNWNFGDGAITTIQNPTHTYAAVANPTSYTVTLAVSNAYGASSVTYLNYIYVNNFPPTAGFYGTPTSGTGPLTVDFTDTSANTPTSWNWSFGDGATTTIQNPSHQYAAVETPTCYPVTLIASNAYGSSTVTENNYICISTTISFQGGIIWDFDSTATTPSCFTSNFYVYNVETTANTNGIGGSNAGWIPLAAPLHTGWGDNGGYSAIWNGTQATPTTINISNYPYLYFSIQGQNGYGSADTSWGVSIMVQDTSHTGTPLWSHGFIPAGDTSPILSGVSLQSTIPVGTYTTLWFNLTTFNYYAAGSVSTTVHPNLGALTKVIFAFREIPKDKKSVYCRVDIDNIGASATRPGSVPIELLNFEAIETLTQTLPEGKEK
jgi:PKD repeat protein